MTFAAVIGQVSTDANSQQNILTDGRLTCLYREIPSFLDQIDYYLREIGITSDVCLALECANSVSGALTLLYLLQKGYRFMLLPPSAGQETDFKPLPAFCQYRLIPNPATGSYAEDERHPENFLAVKKNEQYQAVQNGAGRRREKLYLRTSGSMGASKIAVHSHAKLLGNAHNCVERFQLTAADRVAIAVPIFHMYGLGAGFLPAIIAGASIDLQEKTHLLKYLERERQFDPNVAFLTPALAEMLLQRRGNTGRMYRATVSAGARLKEEVIRAFDDRLGPLVNLYGSTELGAICAPAPDDPLEMRTVTIGRPMTGVTMDLRQKQTDSALMPGADETRIGELYCQHAYGFEAYVDDRGEQISRAATWFRTGDLAKIYPNGAIQILGRADNSMNRDGYLVLLADIEKAMEKIEAVGQVVVLPAPGESKRGQQIIAFCVPNGGALLDSPQIRAKCFDILPKYAIPDAVQVLESLPTLPSGKVDRQALTAMVKANGSVF